MTTPISTIYLTYDHAGFPLRDAIREYLISRGHAVRDVGPQMLDPLDDFPDFACRASEMMRGEVNTRGIFICGTGVGMCIAANRFPHIRAVVGYDISVTEMSRAHNDVNVVCFGARTMCIADIYANIDVFLETDFLMGKYATRNEKIAALHM